MKTSIARGIGVAIATEVAADTAIIGGAMAARGKAPRGLVAVAACLAVAGLALLARMLPAIEDEVIAMAAERGRDEKAEGGRQPACRCRP